MSTSRTNRSLLALNVALAVLLSTFAARPATAIDLKRTVMITAMCGGGAYLGFRLGDKLADIETKKLKLTGAEAELHRKAIKVGTAAAVCGASAYLTGTVYEKMSKRDREALKREQAAAIEDANPGTRNYVLPESGLNVRIETDMAEQDGDKICKGQVTFIDKDPARTKTCKKGEKGKWEVEV